LPLIKNTTRLKCQEEEEEEEEEETIEINWTDFCKGISKIC
jgi:hypothetical protein